MVFLAVTRRIFFHLKVFFFWISPWSIVHGPWSFPVKSAHLCITKTLWAPSAVALAKAGKAFAYNKENYEHMKQYASLWLCALALATTLTSCEVIGGIFKAGFWSAIIVVVVVVGLILWLVGRSRK